uniref:SbsA Ig-like domain-containing protein n=2 Tax=Alexandrium monilatum TaxID=311494 RepID=A0A7S4VNM9_9DINO
MALLPAAHAAAAGAGGWQEVESVFGVLRVELAQFADAGSAEVTGAVHTAIADICHLDQSAVDVHSQQVRFFGASDAAQNPDLVLDLSYSVTFVMQGAVANATASDSWEALQDCTDALARLEGAVVRSHLATRLGVSGSAWQIRVMQLAKNHRPRWLAQTQAATERATTTSVPVTAATSVASGGPGAGNITSCREATTPCACATVGSCGWASAANGGGVCFSVPIGAGVDCFLCPVQDFCPGSQCPVRQEPCGCAADARCRWDVTTSKCVVRTDVGTPCTACPTQEGCSYIPIETDRFEPVDGGSLSGAGPLFVKIWFNVPVVWCHFTGAVAEFWCDGSSTKWWLQREDIELRSGRFQVNVAHIAREITRKGERNCGVEIYSGKICDQELTGFGGLPRGGYRFSLRDAVAPVISAYSPSNGGIGVALDGTLRLTFSEPIVRGDATLVATLSRLEVDNTGLAATVHTATLPLTPPEVLIQDSYLEVPLSGHLQSGRLYTLALPRGAVEDLAGNAFAGLVPHAYTFRATTGALRARRQIEKTSGTSVAAVVAVVSGAVVLLGAAIVGAIRLLRPCQKSTYFTKSMPTQPLPRQSQKPSPIPLKNTPPPPTNTSPAPGPGWQDTEFGSDTTWAQRLSYPRPSWNSPGGSAEAASRVHPGTQSAGSGGSSPQPQRQPRPQPQPQRPQPNPAPRWRYQGPGPNSRWSPFTANRQSSTGRPPGGASGAAGAAAGGARGGGGGPQKEAAQATPSAPAPAPSACPEVRAVERQMRAAMEEPMQVRKKMYKDLMLEYHPDKNSQSYAKEVFQYVNNARGWFLCGS